MTKETIFNEIRKLIIPEFENNTTKFISLAISPYYPIIVVEFDRKLLNTESNRNAYQDYYINGKFIWRRELMHYQVNAFEGVQKLYNKYLNAN